MAAQLATLLTDQTLVTIQRRQASCGGVCHEALRSYTCGYT